MLALETITYRVRKCVRFFCLFLTCFLGLTLSSNLSAEEEQEDQTEVMDAITPMSPSVWNVYNEEPKLESELENYILREAYLVEADRSLLQRESRAFLVPLDDLASSQRRILSPYMREEEEKVRQDYAETVTSIAVNKGVPEYMFQFLGLQKLREGVRKLERIGSMDFTLSKPKKEGEVVYSGSGRVSNPWRLRGVFLPYQRSYRMGLGNGLWNWDVQGGYTTNKSSQLFTTLSARWGRYLQSNKYQLLDHTAISSFSIFLKDDLSFTLSHREEFKDNPETLNSREEIIGVSYIF